MKELLFTFIWWSYLNIFPHYMDNFLSQQYGNSMVHLDIIIETLLCKDIDGPCVCFYCCRILPIHTVVNFSLGPTDESLKLFSLKILIYLQILER